jgi:hypothetical protein
VAIGWENYKGTGIQELQEFRSYRRLYLQPRTKTRIGFIVAAVTILIAGKRRSTD